MGARAWRADRPPVSVRPPLPCLHAVTDERIARRPDLSAVAAELAAGGGAAIAFHARGRGLSGLEHYELAVRLTDRPTVQLFVNDRLDIALACGATGVQLGAGSVDPGDARRLEPRWWIGRSVHDLAEATAARNAGADYLLLGPVFRTATHPGREPLDPGTVSSVVALGLPVIAIGGVAPGRATELKAAGVHGVAAIRALWDADDPAAAARRLLQELEHE
ncbi:MAG: thiamine phosphate synthase [Gemmatimonadetes bacterium]|nr:MAG: thiamine phosphate synthase [Gemmatimonadota bacterium]